ncbi:hypothetical protein E1B28_010852 [Marasmius oreades]|uniref:Uncharacterized protein n=1 Tax=Marasmius oreades TaxID=181124 RepID=A0A9P7UQL3_9AGAR|nr:uncharacterized protein E1B28_010852 [Marasmius oreades]KAG7089146.1 hypothetical protein E1B28_010852 [Marasmius oreades]
MFQSPKNLKAVLNNLAQDISMCAPTPPAPRKSSAPSNQEVLKTETELRPLYPFNFPPEILNLEIELDKVCRFRAMAECYFIPPSSNSDYIFWADFSSLSDVSAFLTRYQPEPDDGTGAWAEIFLAAVARKVLPLVCMEVLDLWYKERWLVAQGEFQSMMEILQGLSLKSQKRESYIRPGLRFNHNTETLACSSQKLGGDWIRVYPSMSAGSSSRICVITLSADIGYYLGL